MIARDAAATGAALPGGSGNITRPPKNPEIDWRPDHIRSGLREIGQWVAAGWPLVRNPASRVCLHVANRGVIRSMLFADGHCFSCTD